LERPSTEKIEVEKEFRCPDDLKKGTDGRLEARVAAVLDTNEGKQLDASTHPGLVAARAEGRDLAGFDANGLFFAESTNRSGKSVIGSLIDHLETLSGQSINVEFKFAPRR
jgi:hypothetical protein